jgi:TrmH family RNA methyltransferase
MTDITSPQNPRVKYIVKLREDKRQRQKDGLFLVEGWDEIQLALSAGHIPQTLLTAPELASRPLSVPSAETVTVSRPAFQKMSYRENPDGWLAVFPIPRTNLASETLHTAAPLVIIAESIEKPGNLGAILRTADAAGVDALLICNPRTDPWNPNVVRASRGTILSVRLIECDNSAALTWLRAHGLRILAATPSASTPYFNVDMRLPTAIAVGTEDEGLSDFWMDNADLKVNIPMMGKVNSLNVSVSTALIVYEAVRQRG